MTVLYKGMKDPHDLATTDMHALPKKRGRPPSAGGLSARERKRNQRARDRAAVLAEPGTAHVTVTALVEALGRHAWAGDVGRVEALCRELVELVRARSGDCHSIRKSGS